MSQSRMDSPDSSASLGARRVTPGVVNVEDFMSLSRPYRRSVVRPACGNSISHHSDEQRGRLSKKRISEAYAQRCTITARRLHEGLVARVVEQAQHGVDDRNVLVEQVFAPEYDLVG